MKKTVDAFEHITMLLNDVIERDEVCPVCKEVLVERLIEEVKKMKYKEIKHKKEKYVEYPDARRITLKGDANTTLIMYVTNRALDDVINIIKKI